MSSPLQTLGPSTSIVLLTYNGERYLQHVLEMLHRQREKPLEIIVIDSGSRDRTLEIVQGFPVQVHSIPNIEFSHSRTRNLGAALAKGKYVVFLTQDATPADSCWLERLLSPFLELNQVAGVFSRQVPRPGCDLLEANDLRMSFKTVRLVRSLPSNQREYRKNIWKLVQFSNVSAAYDRSLLLENPFDEILPMGEDQEWAKRMLEKGYTLVYEPESMVLHSHDYTLVQRYRRGLQMGNAFSRFLAPVLGKRRFPVIAWLYHVFSDLLYLGRADAPFSRRLKWLLLSPLHRAAVHYAYYRGWNSVAGKAGPSTSIMILVLMFCIFSEGGAAETSLDIRYEKIRTASAKYGNGGAEVLKMAYRALSDHHYTLAGIEDLWATALKEGKSLFTARQLWAATSPKQTRDMLGQTTIGPWQITIQTVRKYGHRYGIDNTWADTAVISTLQKNPDFQAHIAADFIEESYSRYGKRTPYAIQCYFWLDAFLQKRIGQGPWYESVLAKDPSAMSNTGFYAKQLLIGSRFNPEGLLYWLYITEDEAAIHEILATWSQNGYPITEEDLNHCSCDSTFREFLQVRFLEKP